MALSRRRWAHLRLYGRRTMRLTREPILDCAALCATSARHGVDRQGTSCRGGIRTLTEPEPGHQGAIFAARFDPSGENIASGSMDRSICALRLPVSRCPVLMECSLVEGGRRMRKLQRAQWSQMPRAGRAMVARLADLVLRLGRLDAGELGCRQMPADPAILRARRTHQLHRRQQARERGGGQRLRR